MSIYLILILCTTINESQILGWNQRHHSRARAAALEDNWSKPTVADTLQNGFHDRLVVTIFNWLAQWHWSRYMRRERWLQYFSDHVTRPHLVMLGQWQARDSSPCLVSSADSQSSRTGFDPYSTALLAPRWTQVTWVLLGARRAYWSNTVFLCCCSSSAMCCSIGALICQWFSIGRKITKD